MKRPILIPIIVILFAGFSLFLLACGGGGGGSSSSDSESDGSITPPKTQISGVLALGSSAGGGRLSRLVGDIQIRLLSSANVTVGLANTTSQGFYTFSASIEDSDYPLTLKAIVNDINYSSVIATAATDISANINEITAAIATRFAQGSSQSQEYLDTVGKIILLNRFSVNEAGNPNIPAEVFVSGEFTSTSSLGNLLLNTAANSSINLLEDAPADTPLLNNKTFLKNFATEIRSAEDTTEAITTISNQEGSTSLAQSLTTIANAETESEVDSLTDNLLLDLSSQITALQEKIAEAEEQLSNLEAEASGTTTTPSSSTSTTTSTSSTSTTTTTTTTSTTTTTIVTTDSPSNPRNSRNLEHFEPFGLVKHLLK